MDTRLKIVALHGWGNSGEMFSAKIGSIRTELKKTATFFFPDGPILLRPLTSKDSSSAPSAENENPASDAPASAAATPSPSDDTVASSTISAPRQNTGRGGVPADQQTANLVPIAPGGRSWYDFSAVEQGTSADYEGVEDCFAYLDAYARHHGPFDGVFGFSQGAVVAAMWAARLNTLPPHMQLKFGIFCSGLLPTGETERLRLSPGGGLVGPSSNGAEDAGGLPPNTSATRAFHSMHIYGLSDNIIAPDRSKRLAHAFSNHDVWGPSLEWTHDGGHVVPSTSRKEIRKFTDAFLTPSPAASGR